MDSMNLQSESKDNWVHEGFQPESFVQLGDYLSSLERRATASTQTAAINEEKEIPESNSTNENNRGPWRARALTWTLVAFIALLLGSNAYALNAKLSLEAENSALQARVVELSRNRAGGASKQVPACPAAVTGNSCPNEFLDLCFFKMSLGPCATDALDDPIEHMENALRFAWESTAEVIGAIGKHVAEDFDKLGKEIQSASTCALNFLGISS
ncbi:unnamed protein product [Ascophyllum nodosum]